MSTGYIVRPAEAEHVDRLPDIERAAATRFGDSLPESVIAHVSPVDGLEAARRAGLLWVALEPSGHPVGFAVASTCGQRVHLDELDVLPQHGRRGIGTALVEAVENHALEGDYTEITLTTFRDVPWNAPFYARLGFDVVPAHELDGDLARRLECEVALGLDCSRRVAMRKRLADTTR